jgi:hypothetical protein
MVDRNGNRMYLGSRIKFYVAKNKLAKERYGGPTRKGTVLHDHAIGSMIDVVLDGDPFGTYVEFNRVEVIPGDLDLNNPVIVARAKDMRVRPTSTRQGLGDPEGGSTKVPTAASKPNTRELRKQAKALGVDGWEDMGVRALQAAVEAAEDNDTNKESAPTRRRSSKATKVPATKVSKTTAKSTKTTAKASSNGTKAKAEAEVAENGNPYKPGSNLFYITEQILKGGKRSKMVTALKKKIELKPRTAGDDWDEDYELDRRILITGQILKKDHGWNVERTGRGSEDGTIQGTPPD